MAEYSVRTLPKGRDAGWRAPQIKSGDKEVVSKSSLNDALLGMYKEIACEVDRRGQASRSSADRFDTASGSSQSTTAAPLKNII